MSDTSAILSLPYIQPAQAQKHVTHNEALRRLDILVQLVVRSRALTAPPAVPDEGECHIVGIGATGPWAGEDDAIAVYDTGQWQFVEPKAGWRAHVLAESRIVTYTVGGWDIGTTVTILAPEVGVNATPDTTNRLAVSAPATLLNHEGAGHQLKLNKATAGDTLSLLYQTGFSGRAEIGLTGSDTFAVKVSPDGSAWNTAVSIDPATGRPALPLGCTLTGTLTGTAAARLGPLLCSYGGTANAIALTYGMAALAAGQKVRFTATSANTGATTINLDGLGAVACRTIDGATALPSGYIRTGVETTATYNGTYWVLDRQIERGSNANGEYVRFADGTQRCTYIHAAVGTDSATGALFQTASSLGWTYPVFFSAAPTVSGNGGRNDRWLAITSTATGSAGMRVLSQTNSAATTPPTFVADGKWY